MINMALIINPKYEQLVPPLTPEEYRGLEESIKSQGYDSNFPIIVWNDMIVDGHNRYKICQAHHIEFKTAEKEFLSEEQVVNWIIGNQLNRRNITKEQRLYLIGKRYESEKKEQGSNRFTQPKEEQNRVLKISTLSESPKPSQKTVEKIAKENNISKDTVQRAEKFVQSVEAIAKNTSLKPQEFLNGQIKATQQDIHTIAAMPKEDQQKVIEKIKDKPLKEVKQVIKEIKKEERQADLQAQQKAINEGKISLPKGLYEIIALDPPWPYGTDYDPEGRRAANPYPEMSLDEIKAIKLPITDNGILFLWTTHKFMRYSFDLIDSWGFRDVSIITWVKDRMGLGTWLRSQSEFCIMCVKGKPKVNLTNQTTVLYGKMREHSRKPDEFYELVNQLCIGRKLDYFSREQRDGWDSMGNDVHHF
jgi:N6-adenosine-specific RNA methylase IME4